MTVGYNDFYDYEVKTYSYRYFGFQRRLLWIVGK